jgi:hypothetical protein
VRLRSVGTLVSCWLVLGLSVVVVVAATLADLGPIGESPRRSTLRSAPPDPRGYFEMMPAGNWRNLPGDASCRRRVRSSTWEPRPDNVLPNHAVPDRGDVLEAWKLRPRSAQGAYHPHWDTWLLPRVTGRYRGTTDEILQWAACKWGVSDNLLRAVALRESNWYQYQVYPDGNCVLRHGCGDVLETATAHTRVFCAALAVYGHDYQQDYGSGRCPRTFSLVGISAWQDPATGRLPDNQNGTFPFSRNSTAFSADYLGAHLRGCHEGWVEWLGHTGAYRSGDIWGCVQAWYSGRWERPGKREYAELVRGTLRRKTWLSTVWTTSAPPPCSADHGCPRGARKLDLLPSPSAGSDTSPNAVR